MKRCLLIISFLLSLYSVNCFAQQERFIGCWIGDSGGRAQFTKSGWLIFRKSLLKYEKIISKPNELARKITIKASGKIKGYSSKTHFFVLDFDQDFYDLIWIRYESENDYLHDKLTGLGAFSKMQCKKQRRKK